MSNISKEGAAKIAAIIKEKGGQIYDPRPVNFESVVLSGIKDKKLRNLITNGPKRKKSNPRRRS